MASTLATLTVTRALRAYLTVLARGLVIRLVALAST